MDQDLSLEQFRRFHDFIYGKAGIHYPQEKLSLLSSRIRARMRATSIPTYDGYLTHLQTPSGKPELQHFFDSITTNETYLFRCQRHWDLFEQWTREVAKKPETKARGLRIWSAAASTGAEACTILISLEQTLGENFGGIPVRILGTDLNQSVLNEAKQAVYRPYALSQTPDRLVKRYFEDLGDERFQFDQKLLRNVTYRTHNLMDPMTEGPFDIIFLRNVMIYFDVPSKQKVLAHALAALRPGGILVVGESESLLQIEHGFVYKHPSWFQKPERTPART
jgi:chemotaxis protein methyltransferase CheR